MGFLALLCLVASSQSAAGKLSNKVFHQLAHVRKCSLAILQHTLNALPVQDTFFQAASASHANDLIIKNAIRLLRLTKMKKTEKRKMKKHSGLTSSAQDSIVAICTAGQAQDSRVGAVCSVCHRNGVDPVCKGGRGCGCRRDCPDLVVCTRVCKCDACANITVIAQLPTFGLCMKEREWAL